MCLFICIWSLHKYHAHELYVHTYMQKGFSIVPHNTPPSRSYSCVCNFILLYALVHDMVYFLYTHTYDN